MVGARRKPEWSRGDPKCGYGNLQYAGSAGWCVLPCCGRLGGKARQWAHGGRRSERPKVRGERPKARGQRREAKGQRSEAKGERAEAEGEKGRGRRPNDARREGCLLGTAYSQEARAHNYFGPEVTVASRAEHFAAPMPHKSSSGARDEGLRVDPRSRYSARGAPRAGDTVGRPGGPARERDVVADRGSLEPAAPGRSPRKNGSASSRSCRTAWTARGFCASCRAKRAVSVRTGTWRRRVWRNSSGGR